MGIGLCSAHITIPPFFQNTHTIYTPIVDEAPFSQDFKHHSVHPISLPVAGSAGEVYTTAKKLSLKISACARFARKRAERTDEIGQRGERRFLCV